MSYLAFAGIIWRSGELSGVRMDHLAFAGSIWRSGELSGVRRAHTVVQLFKRNDCFHNIESAPLGIPNSKRCFLVLLVAKRIIKELKESVTTKYETKTSLLYLK
ncbi:hypothetical protein HNO89_002134 [Sporosarcina luteola]|nr:hypothetical protein [Sporosarcina luteola]